MLVVMLSYESMKLITNNKYKTHMKNNLILSGLHLNLTDSLKSIVYEKMEKYLNTRIESFVQGLNWSTILSLLLMMMNL